MSETISIPRRKKGRPSTESEERVRQEFQAFADRLRKIRSALDFRPGKRGWCYLLEPSLPKGKDDFGRAEKAIDQCRKSGVLPVNFVAEDVNRKAENLEEPDEETPQEYADKWAKVLSEFWEQYNPGSFWDHQPVYVEMMVEKVDLRELFGPICARFHIPIFNARGWSDINSRVAMIQRFKFWEERGKKGVLLCGGDFDPSGFLITKKIRKNLNDLRHAVVENEDGTIVPLDWTPKNLTIDRFGLNLDFINEHKLTWINNLITSSGRNLATHPKLSKKKYVRDYIARYGVRKVEANALVTHPAEARELCLRTIAKYVSQDGRADYNWWLKKEREKVRAVMPTAMRAAARELAKTIEKAE
jgi:hypothetical protein